MGQYVVSVDKSTLDSGRLLTQKYCGAFEIIDFSDSYILDDDARRAVLIEMYLVGGIPAGSLLLGAFQDLSIFSRDSRIRRVSLERMRQSVEIAVQLQLEEVLFYVNAQPYLLALPDSDAVLDYVAKELKPLLQEFPQITFIFENNQERSPELFSRLFRAMGETSNIGFCLNYCRAALSPVPPEQWAIDLSAHLKCVRIFDSNLQKTVSGQDDDLDVFYQRHRHFCESYFADSRILFGQQQLMASIVREESMEVSDLLAGNPDSPLAIPFCESTPEGMLEKIFFYMNQLVGEKGFSSTILLLTDMGRTLANSERASFWYWDTQKKQYWTIVALGRDRIVIDEGTGLVGASIQNNEVLIINDPYSDERFYIQVDIESGFVSRSILCIPVTNSKGKVIGAFQAVNKLAEGGYGKFDEQDVKRLAMAAAYCGRTLETYLLYQETLVDALTGLKNRRGFWEYYEEHLKPNVDQMQVAVVVCDIDFFKNINDTYGHAAGDEVLVRVAAVLQEEAGSFGEVVRWGGEEFILLLCNHNLREAVQLSEKIRCRLMDMSIHFEQQVLNVTMSFGVAEIDSHLTIEKNVDVADKKLYQAKENGRNQVVF